MIGTQQTILVYNPGGITTQQTISLYSAGTEGVIRSQKTISVYSEGVIGTQQQSIQCRSDKNTEDKISIQ